MTRKSCPFATEAELVAAFCRWVESDFNRNRNRKSKWTIYPETAGWDLLLVERETGVQVGVEAKLTLNCKVLEQALPAHDYGQQRGPDYRAVLVPHDGLQNHLEVIANHLGIKVLAASESGRVSDFLPDEAGGHSWRAWHSWLPAERCALPDYVPDVTGGHSAPVQLTHWKIKAIKLVILLDRFGAVTRKDMKALGIDATRWTARGGFLEPGEGGYVRCRRTPDLRAQHPVNYAQIEADFEKWAPAIRPNVLARAA